MMETKANFHYFLFTKNQLIMKRNVFTLLMVGLILIVSSPVFAQSYGLYAEKPGYMLNGDFLNDPNLVDPVIQADKQATVEFITTGDADSVFFGQNAIHVVFTDDAEGKDRLEIKVGEDADLTLFNAGQLVFWIKLLDTIADINFEVSANRNGAGEAKGTDASMKDNYGLDVMNDSTWQKIVIDLALPVAGDNFTYDIFESFSFRSRENASDFMIDEMHVEYYGAYGITADREGWKVDGDFFTDPRLVGANISLRNFATVTEINSGQADSVYFGMNALHVVLTDDVEGKDKVEFKVAEDADLSIFDGGTLVFYIKLLDTITDIHFEVSANRSGAGEAKGTDISMKEEMGLDIMDTVNWQKIMLDLSQLIGGENFTYDIFESFGFRSRGNASDFLLDEMHVILSGGYGMNADNPAYMTDGDFLTDTSLTGATIVADNMATVRMITSGDADSVYFGQNAVYANLTDDAEGKDRLEYKVAQEADMSFFNNGTLIFWIKLLAPTTDINFEVSANRNESGEAQGNDISMKDEMGLDVGNDSTWQKMMLDLSEPIDGDNFNFNIWEAMGFRSRGNASEFIVDEMHVLLKTQLTRYLNSEALLDTLTVSLGDLTPAFSPDVMAYTLEAPLGSSAVTVAALASDTNASVLGTGDYDLTAGPVQATVSVIAENGITITKYVIDITRDATIVEEDEFKDASVYPNPVSDQLIVELGGNEVDVIDIVNLLGQKMLSVRTSSDRVVFNVNNLNEGLYIVTFDGKPYRKIIVQK
jgi:hypothetical protein